MAKGPPGDWMDEELIEPPDVGKAILWGTL